MTFEHAEYPALRSGEKMTAIEMAARRAKGGGMIEGGPARGAVECAICKALYPFGAGHPVCKVERA